MGLDLHRQSVSQSWCNSSGPGERSSQSPPQPPPQDGRAPVSALHNVQPGIAAMHCLPCPPTSRHQQPCRLLPAQQTHHNLRQGSLPHTQAPIPLSGIWAENGRSLKKLDTTKARVLDVCLVEVGFEFGERVGCRETLSVSRETTPSSISRTRTAKQWSMSASI